MRYKRLRVLCAVSLCVLLAISVACGKTNEAESIEPLEELCPRKLVRPLDEDYWREQYLSHYDEHNGLIQAWLEEKIPVNENYSFELSLGADYKTAEEENGETVDVVYSYAAIYKISAMAQEKIVKIEKLSDKVTECKYRTVIYELSHGPVEGIEQISETTLESATFDDFSYYIKINGDSIDFYSPSENGHVEKRHRVAEIAQAFSELFFPSDTEFFEGDAVMSLVNSSAGDSIQVVKNLDVNFFYRPFYLLGGKKSAIIPLTSMMFNFNTSKRTLISVSSYSTNLFGIVYPLVTGKEFPLTYNGADYILGHSELSGFQKCGEFELPLN